MVVKVALTYSSVSVSIERGLLRGEVEPAAADETRMRHGKVAKLKVVATWWSVV